LVSDPLAGGPAYPDCPVLLVLWQRGTSTSELYQTGGVPVVLEGWRSSEEHCSTSNWRHVLAVEDRKKPSKFTRTAESTARGKARHQAAARKVIKAGFAP